MFIVYLLVCMDLLPIYLQGLFSVLFLYLLYTKKRKYLHKFILVLILYFISVSLLNAPINKGIVIQNYDKVVKVSNGFSTRNIYQKYEGNVGDIVEIKGEYKPSNYHPLYRLSGYMNKATITKIYTSLNPYITYKVNNPLEYSFLFNTYEEDFGIMSSLSIQILGFISVVDLLIRRLSLSKHNKKIKYILHTILLALFPSFTTIRLLLKNVLSPKNYYLIILILFPRITSHPIFFLFMMPTLIKEFSIHTYNISYKTLRYVLFFFILNRIHLLEILFFKGILFIGGWIYLGCLIPGISVFMGILLYYLQRIIQSSFWNRFEIFGSFSGLVLLFILYILQKKPSIKKEIIVFFSLTLFYIYFPFARIIYFDVGQGDAIVISYPFNMYTLMIDTGKPESYYVLQKEMKKQGIHKIDTLLITHDDLDHSGNKDKVLQDYYVNKLIDSKKDSLSYLSSFLWNQEYEGENENSLITGVAFNNLSFLFTGDASIQQEEAILQEYPGLSIDILKLGHHGSKTSSSLDFLLELRPKYAIISSDPDAYGHPHLEVLRNLYHAQVIPIQTSNDGTITFTFFPYLTIINTSSGKFVIMK